MHLILMCVGETNKNGERVHVFNIKGLLLNSHFYPLELTDDCSVNL